MKRLLLVFVSAGLLIAAFSKHNFGIVAWFALVPLLLALDGVSGRKAFFLSYLAGVIFWLGAIYWLAHVTLLGLILLVLYLALYFGVFGLVAIRSYILPITSYILFLPSIWVLLEYLRSYLLTGFGWNLLAYSQYQNLPVIQIADIIGAWGVSFLVVVVNVAIKEAVCLIGYPKKWKRLVIPLLIGSLALTVAYSYGYYRLARVNQIKEDVSLKIAVIQGNIPQHLKWKPRAKSYIMRQYLELTREACLEQPDLIIWPEASLPVVLQEEPEFFEEARDLAAETKIPLLLGAATLRNNVYYNSALLVSGQDNPLFCYDKLHLVPFGEYIPFRGTLNFLETILPIGDFQAGREYLVFPLPTRFSVLICFEDLFPELSRRFIQKGADFLVNITNDAWFERTSAPYQHLAASVFRAVENKKNLLRAANTGISGFIAPSGKIISVVSDAQGESIFIKGYQSEKIKISRQLRTFYTRFGDLAIWACFLFGLYIMIRILRKKK